MTENELLAAVRRMCRQLNLYHYHTHNSMHSEPGFPDCIIASRKGVIYRELKSATGKLTEAQKAVIGLLQAGGCDVAVWRPEHLLSGEIARSLAALAGLVSPRERNAG